LINLSQVRRSMLNMLYALAAAVSPPSNRELRSNWRTWRSGTNLVFFNAP
jgi:hypothetical protein